MNAAQDAWARYGPTAIGLLLGTAAKYGVSITEGKPPTRAETIADVLMLGFLGLLGMIASDALHLTGNMKVFAAALAALLSARLVKAVRDRGQARAEQELDTLLGTVRSPDMAKVPAGAGVPDEVGAHSSTADDPVARAGAALQAAHRAPTIEKLPTDMTGQLRAIDASPSTS